MLGGVCVCYGGGVRLALPGPGSGAALAGFRGLCVCWGGAWVCGGFCGLWECQASPQGGVWGCVGLGVSGFPPGRRRNVNCLRHAALWYQDHRGRCPAEPRLAELEPALGLSSTAVWQCERGHRYFQDLHPPRTQSDSDSDSSGDTGEGDGDNGEESGTPLRGKRGCW